MHHVDLVLDPGADAAVRTLWRLLGEAGVPSLARHRSPSNRPHVTVAMTRTWPDLSAVRGALRQLEALPMTARLGAPVVFGRGPFVLALGVVPTQALIALHRALAEVFAPAHDHLRPGAWTPHVTLANRMSSGEVAAALELVSAAPVPDRVTFDSARHWDSVARADRPLRDPGSPTVGG